MLIWQLIIVQVFTFVFIILFLRWLLHGQINRAVKRLRQLNRENREREEALKKETERAKQEIEREIKEGKDKSTQIKKQAKEEAEKKRRDIIYKSKEEATRIIEEGKRDLERTKKDFILDIQHKAVILASNMVRYLITEKAEKNFHLQAVNELIEEMRKLSADKLKAEGDTAEIISTYPLLPEQKDKIKKILSSKLDKNINLKEKVDKNIVAGLTIKLGGFSVIDGSIQGKIKKILPMVKEEMKEFYNN
jgi:F-type H+-transporting ATPase subunit b